MNTAFKGRHARHVETRAVLRNVGRMGHLYTGENVGRNGTTVQVLQALKLSVIEK